MMAQAALRQQAMMAADPVRTMAFDGDWRAILAPDTGLVLLERAAPVPAAVTLAAMDGWAGRIGFAGAPAALAPALADLPAPLAADIGLLATRFAALAGTPAIRLRVELIVTDACRKWHHDYTGLRLVCSYAGPGTEYRAPEDDEPVRVPGQVPALFKGRLFGDGAPLVEHRSPPIAGTGRQRLVLVIDTPDEAVGS